MRISGKGYGKLMYKAAVMGDRDSIYGFAAVGLEPHPVTDTEKAAAELKAMVESDYAVIYITEELAAGLEKEIIHYSERELPAIILIPGVKGNTGEGIAAVKRSVEQAVGSDIIFNN